MAKRTNEQGLSELREARPWTRDEGRRVFDAWGESGETVAEFARRTGLDRRKIYGLRRRLGASPTKQARTAPTFLPVIVRTAPSMPRGEHISAAQLDLFLTKLNGQTPEGALAEANKKLEESAKNNGGCPTPPKPPKQPPVRRPIPPELRRVENKIAVPESERLCPQCGAERRCAFHETTQVIDLIRAEVIVRLDVREVLACANCDGEMQRAPLGDKVVAGGMYGSTLVATLIGRARSSSDSGCRCRARRWRTRSCGARICSGRSGAVSWTMSAAPTCCTSTRPGFRCATRTASRASPSARSGATWA